MYTVSLNHFRSKIVSNLLGTEIGAPKLVYVVLETELLNLYT